jgi:hypothetical protein
MKKIGIMVMGVALAIAGALPAQAADVFYGCSSNTTGKIRKVQVNVPPVCRSTDTLRSWNAEGPQGPQGPGFTECHVEEFPGTCGANTFAVLNATCASGFATGASAIWHTPFDAANNGKFYFFARSGVTWTLIPYNDTGSTQDFRMQLQCCS